MDNNFHQKIGKIMNVNKTIVKNLKNHSTGTRLNTQYWREKFKNTPQPQPPKTNYNVGFVLVRSLQISNKWVNRFFFASLFILAGCMAFSTYILLAQTISSDGNIVFPFFN